MNLMKLVIDYDIINLWVQQLNPIFFEVDIYIYLISLA